MTGSEKLREDEITQGGRRGAPPPPPSHRHPPAPPQPRAFAHASDDYDDDLRDRERLPSPLPTAPGPPRVGLSRGGVKRPFVPPQAPQSDDVNSTTPSFVRRALGGPPANKRPNHNNGGGGGGGGGGGSGESDSGDPELPERLKGCDPKLVELISHEMMDHSPGVAWDDIAGLTFAKKCVVEIVVWPMRRPELFRGLRGPPKGILLFGPPGTGKTLIGKAIASESGARFFSISASSLTSKWHGEGEKLVRTLFAVAALHQPSIIFIDEIDSLLAQRSESEFEGSRRLKTEFLVQLDGAATSAEERVLVVGATNRPQELDEAARRRLVKRLYIPLPDAQARRALLDRLLRNETHSLTPEEMDTVVRRTEGYSGADCRALCTEAAFGPIRAMDATDIGQLHQDSVRPIGFRDFEEALLQVRASVSTNDLRGYEEWNRQFGSFPFVEESLAKASAMEAAV